MHFRDFRNAGITDLRARGSDSAIAAKVAGHSEEMSFHYTQAPGKQATEAVLRLGPERNSYPGLVPRKTPADTASA